MTLAVDSIQLPADVRAAGTQAQKLYASALGFEQMLTSQLAKSLASAMGSGDGEDGGDDASGTGGSGADSATSQLKQQLPSLLSDAVTQGGGLGLARQLYTAMAAQQGVATAPAGAGATGAAK